METESLEPTAADTVENPEEPESDLHNAGQKANEKESDEKHTGDKATAESKSAEMEATVSTGISELCDTSEHGEVGSVQMSVAEKTMEDGPAIESEEEDARLIESTEPSPCGEGGKAHTESELHVPPSVESKLAEVNSDDDDDQCQEKSPNPIVSESVSGVLVGTGNDDSRDTENALSARDQETSGDNDIENKEFENVDTAEEKRSETPCTETPESPQLDDHEGDVPDESSVSPACISDKIEESKQQSDDANMYTPKDVDLVGTDELIDNGELTSKDSNTDVISDQNISDEGNEVDGRHEEMDVDVEVTKDDSINNFSEPEEVEEKMDTSLEKVLNEVESSDPPVNLNDEQREDETAVITSHDVEEDDNSPAESSNLATDEANTDKEMDVGSSKELAMDDVTGLLDTSSKSPISDVLGDGKTTPKAGSAEKRGKASSKLGFSLGNIVSRLKIQVESKQEETEVKKEAGDAVPEKTQSKRSEQKQQGKQMRAAAHAAMMMYKDDDYDDEEEEQKNDSTQEKQGGGSKDMTSYANNTMDELLGLYGYEKPEGDDSLQLGSSLSQSKISITGSVTSHKQNQKQNQAHKPSQGDTGLVISNVTSMAPAQSVADNILQEALKKKTNYCAECSLVVDDAVMLVASDHSFCSQACLDNYQSRQTLVCDYCSGMITQAATQKFVRETREGQKKFCSQPCSEEFSKRVRNCNTCGKEISKASEGILAPVGSGGKFVDFCKQECVDNYGKKPLVVKQGQAKQDGVQPRYWAQDTFFVCAVCNNYAKAKHVISLQGKLNGLCSADCFTKFKEKNQLAFSLCSQCSALCSNQKMMRSIEIEGKVHRFCSMRCFKMKLKRSMSTIACAACKKPNWAQSMIEEWNGTELVRFFCSTACLGKRDAIPFASTVQKTVPTTKPSIPPPAAKTPPTSQKQPKPQQAHQSVQSSVARPSSTSGNKCDHCNKEQRPQYHLTMSDNSIRNFCTYGCVIAFQAQFNVPPVTLPQETLQLTCSQCHRGFSSKPLPLDFKGVVNVFCAQNCLDEFKRVNSVVLECDYCHLEKILHECIYFSGQARSFCSEGCKLLFKQQFAQRLGLRCTVCDYCAQTCRSRVERMYGNHKKKFCSMACKAQYDKWLSKGAKCDGCKCTGRKLEESFMWRGEMKRVCNQHCLLLFYTQQNIPNMSTQTQSTIPAIQLTQVAPKTTTPVITNVMSLAPGQQQQTGIPTNNVKYQQKVTSQNVVPTHIIKKCHKQTQITTAPPKVVRPPPPPMPVPPAPKMVKNKVTLVKPFTQTKSVSCRPLTSTKGTMTDKQHPMIIPVPVPIYVPVPMHMYTTPVPHPITLPVPVPVPVFIPVAYSNADRLLASIKEISERIPSDPLEAEMLMLADAIAGDGGGPVSKPDDALEMSGLPMLDEGDDFSSLTIDDADEVLPSQFLADNILKMAADIAHVIEEEPNNELQDDLTSLQAIEEPKVDVPTRTTRSKSGRTSGRRGRSRGNKRACVEEPLTPEAEEPAPQVKRSKEESRNTIGVNAYRYFVSQKKTGSTGKELKSLTLSRNLLEVSTEELAYILCLMCKEGTQPDGAKYSSDILHLIFLSIQHHLSDNGRPENIFTDQFYRRFTDMLHEEIKEWTIDRHPVTDAILNTCINEETLWNAKQLGAHSPYILLSTMIYFNAKHFQLKTLDQHKALAFCRIQKHIRKMGTARSMFLRYYPADRKKTTVEPASKRKRDRDSDVESVRLEQSENTDNPLRCPVRLYEFYLSKCPDSVRSHSELFYLVPERSCVPDSPVWYSSAPLGDHDMNKILTRMLMVTDIHDSWAELTEDTDDV